ncbi:hypothetical protein CP532_1409 [Ophiocordyceps camponoti-leonardi (nom. inval.)]|nr:hypothetical protein CP532_1409 [Ophiocordyceps camponoti-leonardi (nom. inval.)]
MLRRVTLASRRATATQTSFHLPVRERRVTIQPARHLSFLPWKRKRPPTPALPVYFPRTTWSPLWRRWKTSLGWLAFSAVLYYLCLNVFLSTVGQAMVDWSDEEWEALSEAERREIEKEESEGAVYMFLPMPFSTIKVPQPPYRGSDPEWKTFVRISRSSKFQHDVKADLVGILHKVISANKEYAMFLGGKDIKVGRLWLDITFPNRPPPKHYIHGLAFCNDGIYWSRQPIEASLARSLDETVYPKAVALTFWTFWTSLLRQNAQFIYNSFAANEPSTSFPINAAPPKNPGNKSIAASNQPTSSSSTSTTTTSSSSSSSKPPPSLSPSSSSSSTSPPSPSPPPSASSNLDPSQIKRVLMTNPLENNESIIDAEVRTALQDALKTLSSKWRPSGKPPSPGCFFVDGVVEFHGHGASVGLYVWAWYDPKLRGWTSITLGLKHWKPHVQSPAD